MLKDAEAAVHKKPAVCHIEVDIGLHVYQQKRKWSYITSRIRLGLSCCEPSRSAQARLMHRPFSFARS